MLSLFSSACGLPECRVCVCVTSSCPTLAVSWTVALQAPLSREFSRQVSWNGLPFPSPEDLPNPGTKPASPALAGGSFTTSNTWEAHVFFKKKSLLSFLPTFWLSCLFSDIELYELWYILETKPCQSHCLQIFSPIQWKWKLLSHVWLFATPWTVACQVPLSMEFSRPEYWSG